MAKIKTFFKGIGLVLLAAIAVGIAIATAYATVLVCAVAGVFFLLWLFIGLSKYDKEQEDHDASP